MRLSVVLSKSTRVWCLCGSWSVNLWDMKTPLVFMSSEPCSSLNLMKLLFTIVFCCQVWWENTNEGSLQHLCGRSQVWSKCTGRHCCCQASKEVRKEVSATVCRAWKTSSLEPQKSLMRFWNSITYFHPTQKRRDDRGLFLSSPMNLVCCRLRLPCSVPY